MALPPNLFLFIALVLSLCLSRMLITESADSQSSSTPTCFTDEVAALLEFKHGIEYNASASKIESWNAEENCCSWFGVECDKAGHVIGLDVSSSYLSGSINSTNSIFRLVMLQSLNLADNYFNHSSISTEIGKLQQLTCLNLSQSSFSGQVPSELSNLTKLKSLDLSWNVDISGASLLQLEKPTFQHLLQNLRNLEDLLLDKVNISSDVPQILANLSSLRRISLRSCDLQGEFPMEAFQLPSLEVLTMKANPHLTGQFPNFNRSSNLSHLGLSQTNFYGELPGSIGNLSSLQYLELYQCNFSGQLPSSLGDLSHLMYLDLSRNQFGGHIPHTLSNLSELTSLSLSHNNFVSGQTLSWLGKQTKLVSLRLKNTSLIGEIPSSLGNLTQLEYLNLCSNKLTGRIPVWIGNLTQLADFLLADNDLHGPIPYSISRLVNLEKFRVTSNHLSGSVDLSTFSHFKLLKELSMSSNNITFIDSCIGSCSLSKLEILNLRACNLSKFPDFLQRQDTLVSLDLSDNRICGNIPDWIFRVGEKNLEILRLGNNLITGELSQSLCKMISLRVLDLNKNNVSGKIPQCLDSLSNTLSVLHLRHNSFGGEVPQICNVGSKLWWIDLSENYLQGQVPASLANCRRLRILNLGFNQIIDVFPAWLQSLPEVQIVILKSNQFHGLISSPTTTRNDEFFKLRIFDISQNKFSGKHSRDYFKHWNAMRFVDTGMLSYVGMGSFAKNQMYYSVTMTSKGTERTYKRIPDFITSLDLSSNNFEGEIPESIGALKDLQSLNFSNNDFIGMIPLSLGNLTALESLDLSQNGLSGESPPNLMMLTFLDFLNLSYNHLQGPIPRGYQFNTFTNISYIGNHGLCGIPLSKLCGSLKPDSLQAHTDDKDGESLSYLMRDDWLVIAAGYGSGLLIGLAIGNITIKKLKWFAEETART